MEAALIARKLSQLHHQLDRADRKRPADLDEFVANEDAQALVALAIFVAIQEATDLAFHMIGANGWGVPASYAEAFKVLADHRVIDQELAQRMASTIRLRNLIAHGYATLEPKRLWNDLPAGLDTLRRFARAVARFAASSISGDDGP